MNPRNVIIIPPTIPNQPSLYLGTPGKTHVVGYARVEKGTGAAVQIRKNIRQLISDQPEWELVLLSKLVVLFTIGIIHSLYRDGITEY